MKYIINYLAKVVRYGGNIPNKKPFRCYSNSHRILMVTSPTTATPEQAIDFN